MGRIRTIKPEIAESPDFNRCSRDARLTFLLLFTVADDEGRLHGDVRLLASRLFPYDCLEPGFVDRLRGWLLELAGRRMLTCYAVAGEDYVCITAWHRHQRIDKGQPSRHPAPPAGNSENVLGIGQELENNVLGGSEGKGPYVSERARETEPVDNSAGADPPARKPRKPGRPRAEKMPRTGPNPAPGASAGPSGYVAASPPPTPPPSGDPGVRAMLDQLKGQLGVTNRSSAA